MSQQNTQVRIPETSIKLPFDRIFVTITSPIDDAERNTDLMEGALSLIRELLIPELRRHTADSSQPRRSTAQVKTYATSVGVLTVRFKVETWRQMSESKLIAVLDHALVEVHQLVDLLIIEDFVPTDDWERELLKMTNPFREKSSSVTDDTSKPARTPFGNFLHGLAVNLTDGVPADLLDSLMGSSRNGESPKVDAFAGFDKLLNDVRGDDNLLSSVMRGKTPNLEAMLTALANDRLSSVFGTPSNSRPRTEQRYDRD
jgi:hypothetical protein